MVPATTEGEAMRGLRSARAAVLAAGVTVVARRALDRVIARGGLGGSDRWQRSNHRGAQVTLAAGPATAAGAVCSVLLTARDDQAVRISAAVAGGGAMAVGLLDDLCGSGQSRGLRGHLGSLSRGELTTGAVKIAGIGLAGLLAAAACPPTTTAAGTTGRVNRLAGVLAGGAALAGHANVVNLFDLRPGRAGKVVLAHLPLAWGRRGVPVAAAVGAAAAALPDDLGERAMLGDTGANALGALVGVSLVAREGTGARLVHLGMLVALTLASERISFSEVIRGSAPLRALDELGHVPQ